MTCEGVNLIPASNPLSIIVLFRPYGPLRSQEARDTQLARSGIPALDRLLGGGLPPTPNIVVSGSQQDTYLFSQRLIWHRLNAGDVCLYATLSRTQEELCKDLSEKGWDISPFIRTRALRAVDYLSLAGGKPETSEERLSVLFTIGKETLTPESFHQILVREFRDARDGVPERRLFIIFDSVDRLLAAMGLENTLRFAEMAFKTLQGTNSIAVALLCNEFVSEETLEAVRAVASIFIELKQEWRGKNIRRMVRVAKPQKGETATDWIPWYY